MSKPVFIGHNGFSFETRDDLPPDLPKLFYAKFTLQDVLDDLLRMPKEERGVYMTALLVMYKEMEGLPADDKMAAMSLGLDVREWRNIKPKLVARGVLYQRPTGRISNRRFEAEICSYVTEFKKRQEAAFDRERRKRERAEIGEIAETSPRHRREIGDRSPIDRRDVGRDFSEKLNKNNEGTTTTPTHARASYESMSYESESKRSVRGQPPPPESGAVVHDGGGAPPRWVLHPDGSYSGTAFEGFTAVQVQAMSVKWPHLDFPSVLAECDDFLAPEFANQRIPFGHASRAKRLEGLLAHKNRQAKALAAQIAGAHVPDSDSCWFDDAGRLHVANGFKAELLEVAGGDEGRLRRTLDKCSAEIGIDMRGRVLMKNVRSRFAKEVDWARQDERKTRAVEQRGVSPRGSADAAPAPSESRQERIARQMREFAAPPREGGSG